jgi:hypothetical protein
MRTKGEEKNKLARETGLMQIMISPPVSKVNESLQA